MTRHGMPIVLAFLGLALPSAANAQDYAMIKVLSTEVIEIPSGPGDTSAILSPDGSRVFSIGTREMCLLAPAQTGPWAELDCVEKDRDNRIRGPWDMRWSPDGKTMLMPTHMDAFLVFHDTDITILDPEGFGRTVLTDDGVADSLMNSRERADWDVAARWVDEDTIAFVRYEIPAGGLQGRKGPWVMTVETDGGEPRQASKLIMHQGFVLYALAVSPDGRQYAYTVEIEDDADASGLYVSAFGGAPSRIASIAGFGKLLSGIEFSADGRFVMVLGSGEGMDAPTIGHVVEVETGAVTPVAPGQPLAGAAWAPTGSAIAYLIRDRENPSNPGGLFVSTAPGEPGRLLIGGLFNASTCCNNEPFVWASNDTMLLGRGEDASTTMLYVQLGR